MNHRLVRHVPHMSAVACLLLYSATGVGDAPREIIDHPGFRPDSPQAARFVAEYDTATIVVHPTIVRRAKRTAHSFTSQSQIIELLGAAGMTARPGRTRVDLGSLAHQSQWDLFQGDLNRIAEKVKGKYTDARYHLVLEFLLPVSDGEIFGIECYVLDQEGNNAFSFLLNSHHRLFVDARLAARNSSEEARSAMLSRATQTAVAALQAQIAEQRGKSGRAAARDAMLAAGDYVQVVFDDFESTVPMKVDDNEVPVGFITFTDGRSHIDVSTTAPHPAVPGAAPGNQVLQLEMDVDSWAGFAHFFYFHDVKGVAWSPFDWRAFDGISFWLYGQDRGVEIFVDIIDNRNPGSTSDDAERFVYTFSDNFSGWRRVAIVFDDFVRKEIGNGAPNDGLGLSAVHGWGIGTTHMDGPATYLVDDFALLRFNASPPEASKPDAAPDYALNELPMYGMRTKTPAQRRADERYIRQMTKGGRPREEAAQVAAKNAWNVFYSGDKLLAIKRFNQAWLLDPGNQLALWGFAVTCMDRGQIEDAARYYRRAIDSGPPNPSLERDYRLALRQLEKMKQVARPPAS